MTLHFLALESDTFLAGQLALYRRLDRQARERGWALTPEGAALLAQYEAEAARRDLTPVPAVILFPGRHAAWVAGALGVGEDR